MTETLIDETDVAAWALGLGDDALILCQQLCRWITCAPTIEEDLAVSNIALDLLGHARHLLSYSGNRDQTGRSEDDLAYTRTERAFRNCLVVELPQGDYAFAMVRLAAFSHYSRLLYRELSTSVDPDLAAFAIRAGRETEHHRAHSEMWLTRFGRGTTESRRRVEAALAGIWPYLDELFDSSDEVRFLAERHVAVDPAALQPEWSMNVTAALDAADLEAPGRTWIARGGRTGLHTEGFGVLVAELQSVHRQYPGGSW